MSENKEPDKQDDIICLEGMELPGGFVKMMHDHTCLCAENEPAIQVVGFRGVANRMKDDGRIAEFEAQSVSVNPIADPRVIQSERS